MLEIVVLLLSGACWNDCSGERSTIRSERLCAVALHIRWSWIMIEHSGPIDHIGCIGDFVLALLSYQDVHDLKRRWKRNSSVGNKRRCFLDCRGDQHLAVPSVTDASVLNLDHLNQPVHVHFMLQRPIFSSKNDWSDTSSNADIYIFLSRLDRMFSRSLRKGPEKFLRELASNVTALVLLNFRLIATIPSQVH